MVPYYVRWVQNRSHEVTSLLTVLDKGMELWYLSSVLVFHFVLPLSWDLKVSLEALFGSLRTLVVEYFLRPFYDFRRFHVRVFSFFLLGHRVIVLSRFQQGCVCIDSLVDILGCIFGGTVRFESVFALRVWNRRCWDQSTFEGVTFDVIVQVTGPLLVFTGEECSIASWTRGLGKSFKRTVQMMTDALNLLGVKPRFNLQMSVFALVEFLLIYRRWMKRVFQVASCHVETVTREFILFFQNCRFTMQYFSQFGLMIVVLQSTHLCFRLLVQTRVGQFLTSTNTVVYQSLLEVGGSLFHWIH